MEHVNVEDDDVEKEENDDVEDDDDGEDDEKDGNVAEEEVEDDDVAGDDVEDDDVEDDDVRREENDYVEKDDVEEKEDDDVEGEDVEEEDRSQDHDPQCVKVCTVEMHLDIAQQPFYAKSYTKYAAPQDHDNSFVQTCAVEMHMDKTQKPVFWELTRKNAGNQIEDPDQAPALTLTVRPLMWTLFWGRKWSQGFSIVLVCLGSFYWKPPIMWLMHHYPLQKQRHLPTLHVCCGKRVNNYIATFFVFTLRMFLAALSSKTKFVVRFLHKNGIYILMRSYVLSALPLWQIIVPVLQMTQHVFDM